MDGDAGYRLSVLDKIRHKTSDLIGLGKAKAKEIYEYRNMIRSLVTRNLFGRYKNSYLGFAWNFVAPIIYLILCYILFTEVRARSTDNYVLFLSSAIFVYNMLIRSITSGASLFVSNSGMIKKMYFPREILAIASAISTMIVTLIGSVLVFILAGVTGYGYNPVALLLFPVILILTFIFYVGCSLFFGSISVYVRDVQYFMASLSIAFFICTPLRYMVDEATGLLQTIVWINPLTYFVEPLHQIFYVRAVPELWMIGVEALLSFGALVVGYLVFRKLKNRFVEKL